MKTDPNAKVDECLKNIDDAFKILQEIASENEMDQRPDYLLAVAKIKRNCLDLSLGYLDYAKGYKELVEERKFMVKKSRSVKRAYKKRLRELKKGGYTTSCSQIN